MQDGVTRNAAVDSLVAMVDLRESAQDLPFPGILTWDGLDCGQ